MDDVTRTAIEHLAGRWREVDTTALAVGFELLAGGTPANAREVAEAAAIPESRALAALASDRIGKDEHGRLVEIFGVSLSPAAYRIRFEGGELFACCALVAIMVPSLIGREVEISTRDAESHERIRLEVGVEGVIWTAPQSIVATLVETEAKALLEDVGESFCRHVRLFASPASASKFESADPRRRVVPVSELVAMGRALFTALWDPESPH